MTDGGVETLLSGLEQYSFKPRDEEEVSRLCRSDGIDFRVVARNCGFGKSSETASRLFAEGFEQGYGAPRRG